MKQGGIEQQLRTYPQFAEPIGTAKNLVLALDRADEVVSCRYLACLNQYEVASSEARQGVVSIRKIETIAYDKHERLIDKLTNVYNVLMGTKTTLVYMIVSDGKSCDFYLGARGEDTVRTNTHGSSLKDAFVGNFPGSRMSSVLRPQATAKLLETVLKNQSKAQNYKNHVVSVSGVPSLKTEAGDKFIQGMENMLDSMRGKKFSAIIIADALEHAELQEIRRGYEDLYSQLAPFATIDINNGINESEAKTVTHTEGFTEGIMKSLSKSRGTAHSTTTTTNTSENYTRNCITSFFVNIFGGKSGSTENMGHSNGDTVNEQTAEQSGEQKSSQKQDAVGSTDTYGTSKSCQVRLQNKTIQEQLKKIDRTLERLQLCEDLGAWKSAAYFIAEDKKIASIAARTYNSIMRGKDVAGQPALLNVWESSPEMASRLDGVLAALSNFKHPRFHFPSSINGASTDILVDPSVVVSGSELAQLMGMPTKSLPGLPVMEFAPFGRDVVRHVVDVSPRPSVHMGNVFHMGEDGTSRVDIDLQSLTMHTFVTGTTGSGKSNTVYHLLNELLKHDIGFLVVEPAKGEYKNIFGGVPGVRVFGTNANIMDLFKVNPFSFGPKIHVLEHVDKLMEIFKACWSMYAAMPSLLKQAVIRCYEDKGWDVERSVNYDGRIFPGFADLLKVLPEVIAESDFEGEVKGNYVGALVERVRELTEGIERQVFAGEPVSDDILFDGKCIVDLSRGLSAETKSLVMGVIVMRMFEYHSSKSLSKGMNQALKHVTVLEEAHNLLRKTSMQQSQEGANVQGKAVEMITNAICEMRTYGEGFVIVDQSPTALDDSVVRNTNTKIVHRITTSDDYTFVGRSAGATDEQLTEIPKLRDGVAVIFQNNWLQPVLCHMDRFIEAKPYSYESSDDGIAIRREQLGYLVKAAWSRRCGMDEKMLRKFLAEKSEQMTAYWSKEEPMLAHRISELIAAVKSGRDIIDGNDCNGFKGLLRALLPMDVFSKIVCVAKPTNVSVVVERMRVKLRLMIEFQRNQLVELEVLKFMLIEMAEADHRYDVVLQAFRLMYIKNNSNS